MTIARRITLEEFSRGVDNIGFQYLSSRGVTIPLGRWTLGVATDDLNFEGVPDLVVPEDATDAQKRDIRHAQAMTTTKLRNCFEAFIAARQELARFLQEEHRLELLGYNDKAMRDTLNLVAAKSLIRLERYAIAVVGYRESARSLYEKLGSDFGEFEESDTRQVIYDLALVKALEDMPAHKRAAWLAMIPRGGVDRRTLAAVFRVPPALHSFNTLQLETMRAEYVKGSWPNAALGIFVLEQGIDAAQVSMKNAVNILGTRSSLGAKAAAKSMGKVIASWLEEEVQSLLTGGARATR